MSERFTYYKFEGGDLAPPHGIIDTHTGKSDGTWSTEHEAKLVARGMNMAARIIEKELLPYRDACETFWRMGDRAQQVRRKA